MVEIMVRSQESVATKTDIERDREVLKAKIDGIEGKIDNLKSYFLFCIAIAQIAGAILVFTLIKLFQ